MILPLCNSDTAEEGTKEVNKLNPYRVIATTVLSHNITSLPGGSEELRREDSEQEALRKHAQDDSGSDNPRML